jgi:hypothetical protein
MGKPKPKWKTIRGERVLVDDPMIPIVRTARRQLEARADGPLGWLVDFVRSEPEQWVPGNSEAHGHCLLALVYGPMSDNLIAFPYPIQAITPAEVVALHGELRASLMRLVNAPGMMDVPSAERRETLVRVSERNAKPAAFTIMPRGANRKVPIRTPLFQAVKELILATDRLIACRHCGRPHLALRKRLFCEHRCLQAWYDARRPRKGGRR